MCVELDLIDLELIGTTVMLSSCPTLRMYNAIRPSAIKMYHSLSQLIMKDMQQPQAVQRYSCVGYQQVGQT